MRKLQKQTARKIKNSSKKTLLTLLFSISLITLNLQEATAQTQNRKTTPTEQVDTLSFKKQLKIEANKIPLSKLNKNPTFDANFNDAQHLNGKRVELSKKTHLTEDEKVLLAMEEYFLFKEYTSTRDMQDMRNFLAYYNDDFSYRHTNETTDEFITSEYLRIMDEYEDKMQNVATLMPDMDTTFDTSDWD